MKLSIFCQFVLKTPIHAQKLGFWGYFTPKTGSNINKNPKGTSACRSGSSGVLIMSLSAIVPEKSHGNKKCDEGGGGGKRRRTTHFWPFWHRCKMSAAWLYATLLISICSFCRGQHADVNILSIALFFRFSGVAKNRP